MAGSLHTTCLTNTSIRLGASSLHNQIRLPARSTAFSRGIQSLQSKPCHRINQQCKRARRHAAKAMMDEGELLPDVDEGTKVRVTQEILVYHAPKTKELQLKDKEGTVKTIVKHYKGKDTSANLPYRVEFMLELEGGKQQKWFAHLSASEIEKID